MSSKYRMKSMLYSWKNKAITRGDQLRYQRKENIRIKKERDHYKKEFKDVQKQLEKELKKNSQSVSSKEDIVYIALQLYHNARIGFRAVSRVLKVLVSYLGISKAPCTQTVINWVTRLSIAKIQNCTQMVDSCSENAPISNNSIFILDTSIGLGSGKILTVLALDMQHYVRNEKAPNLQNVRCVAVSVAVSWTGENIANFLEKIITIVGKPVAYLKDGGKDLGKAVRILSERDLPSLSIDDISHVIANLLKHKYKNHPMFETFISACSKASKNLKQSILACLTPPKVTTKARFMNLHRLVNWADKVLKQSPKGRTPKNSILSKLRESLDQIPQCKTFITQFLRDANPLLECEKILKNKGLSIDTYSECKRWVEYMPIRSSVRIGFLEWAEKQLAVAEQLGLDALPVCSDNIESLFAVAKQHGTGVVKDADRMALRIPAICGELTIDDARQVLNVSVRDQRQIEDSFFSLTAQRRKILQNPGCLDQIICDDTKQHLELLPDPKKRSKNEINDNIPDNYKKPVVPL